MKTFIFIRWACYFIVLFKLSETTFSDLVGVFFIIILLLDFLLWSIALVIFGVKTLIGVLEIESAMKAFYRKMNDLTKNEKSK